MKRIVVFGFVAVLLWVFWLALAGSLDPQEMIAGAAAAALVTLLRWGQPCLLEDVKLLHPKRLFAALAYIPYMLWAIVRANLDVARRVVKPRLDINPGIVRIQTRLKHPVARMILANSITLTPGTLTVEVEGDDLYIHWIDVHAQDSEAASKEIAAGFEKYLEVIFG
ncbi:MAG: Na+/H+ antiporter subunit E [Planctomycetota bacterium]